MHTTAQFESNLVPMPLLQPGEGPLSEAFSSFISAADVLERSYRSLQDEVRQLRLELQESHCDLARSLRENEQMRHYLGGIVESLPCGVIVLDRAGRPKMTNQEANRLIPGKSSESLNVLSQAVRQKIGAEREYDLSLAREVRSISVKRAQLESAEGAEPESVIIVRDITDERKLEKERADHRRIQALAEISAVLAHEVRNPLTSMELFASLLAETLPQESEQLGWTQQMQAGLRLLAATVNNVLQFYSERPLQLFPLNVKTLLDTSINLLQPVARQNEIEILFEPITADTQINGDAHKLQQVFFNLAVNAFRAMQPGQSLTIGLETAKGSLLRISFRDQGCGIAVEDLAHIFEPGFTRSCKGPGLGLSVCDRIIKQHNGSINVLSAPSVGSTFILEFPLLGESA